MNIVNIKPGVCILQRLLEKACSVNAFPGLFIERVGYASVESVLRLLCIG